MDLATQLHRRSYSGCGGVNEPWRKPKVNTLLLKLHIKLEDLASRVDGQDMVEYALVLGLLSFGVTAATKFLAQSLASAFSGLNTTMTNYIS